MQHMKKRNTLLALAFFVSCLCAFSQKLPQNETYLKYISQYRNVAVNEMYRYGIPASITMAQGLLESGAGQSELARKANNHFGIKCGGDWNGPTSYHDDDATGECFRSYDSVLESFEDHSQFLRVRERYSRLFKLKRTDYKGWAYGLKAAGYATSPTYAQSLIRIIETYELYKLDTAAPVLSQTLGEAVGGATVGYNHGALPSTTSRPIYQYNKNYYIVVKQGDTFRSLSKELGISRRKLASYNERDKDDVLTQGEILYLKKKQSKAEKKYKKVPHVVKVGESMYTIAQRYGMRLDKLYKMNHLSVDYKIRVGDKLKVR